MNKRVLRFTKKGDPELVTHELMNENDDIIFNTLKTVGLNNKEDDKVKVIFYPTYLTVKVRMNLKFNIQNIEVSSPGD